jgi:purine-binding chemotaxis protein CheW
MIYDAGHEPDVIRHMELRQLRDNPAMWEILEARARALAHQETAEDAILGEATLIFQIGDGRYGVSAQLVREVQPLAGYTPLPGTPPFVFGLINLRGRLLAALDIRPLLGSPVASPRPGAALLIVSAGGMEVGLLADEVIEIRRCATQLSSALSSAEGQVVAWVRGIDSGLTVLLDLALLLADSRLVVNNAGDRGLLISV